MARGRSRAERHNWPEGWGDATFHCKFYLYRLYCHVRLQIQNWQPKTSGVYMGDKGHLSNLQVCKTDKGSLGGR